MNRYIALVVLLLLANIGITTGCSGTVIKVQEVTFDRLFANPDHYNDRQIILEGFYFGGFEVSVLSEKLEYSGYAPGHLVPKGRMVWIEGTIPPEVFEKLYQQQSPGPVDIIEPTERYGKVRIRGKFEYGAKYGHLGGYSSQIVPTQVVLLPWSPPAQQ